MEEKIQQIMKYLIIIAAILYFSEGLIGSLKDQRKDDTKYRCSKAETNTNQAVIAGVFTIILSLLFGILLFT